MTKQHDPPPSGPRRLISIDIDGTLEFGDPPGPVTAQWVRLAKAQGYTIGSASDRPISDQQRLWQRQGLEADFFILKHWMDQLRAQFPVEEYWHIGDGQMDELFAGKAGFTFFKSDSFPENVTPYLNGESNVFGGFPLKE